MLRSDVDEESEPLPIKPPQRNEEESENTFTLDLDFTPTTVESQQPRDLYVSLYMKNHTKHEVPLMPLLSIHEWNTGVEFDALLSVVE